MHMQLAQGVRHIHLEILMYTFYAEAYKLRGRKSAEINHTSIKSEFQNSIFTTQPVVRYEVSFLVLRFSLFAYSFFSVVFHREA